jgi:flagellar hook assembly protein FlgD
MEIEFTLPQTSEIKLDIFNINGQLIKNLISSTLNTGTHKVEWDSKDNNGKNVKSGIYLYRLTADEFVITKNMVLLK